MASERIFYFFILFSTNVLMQCASAAVHSHSHAVDNNLERESDGSYRARDYEHYGDAGHNSEFDHEAILGARLCLQSFCFRVTLPSRRQFCNGSS